MQNMNLSRAFTKEVDGRAVQFIATYNPQTHFFDVVEDGDTSYVLMFNPATKAWTTSEGAEPALPVDQLAQLVQQSFGVFV